MKIHFSPLILAVLCLTSNAWCAPSVPMHPKRNPFQPVATPAPQPSQSKRPPLEQYPLSALTLTAIVTNMEGQLFASVEIPSGVGFKVVRGTILGESRARVSEISQRGIVVEEEVRGVVLRREINLRGEP
jgi:Tfp pilus assembly protein PilP